MEISQIPLIVAFFLWLVFLGKSVLTVGNMMSRGIPWSNRSCLFCKGAELVRYFFIHCVAATSVWSFLKRFTVVWVISALMEELLHEWNKGYVGGLSLRGKVIWHCIPAAVCCGLSMEWNKRIFEETATETVKLQEIIFAFLYSWVSQIPLFIGC